MRQRVRCGSNRPKTARCFVSSNFLRTRSGAAGPMPVAPLTRSAPIMRLITPATIPMRHKTNTVDYIVVLKGEIYA